MSSWNSLPYTPLPTDAPTRARICFGSWVTSFWRDPFCHIETPTWNFYKEMYKQKWYRKGLLIALLEESHKEYLQVSLQVDSALMCCHEQKPQERLRSRWLQERDIEQSAPTHVCHIHCTSRQLGTTANQRYDVPWDWLWDACEMARVCQGNHCKGFRSKEGLHYQIERSARSPLEHKQVQRVIGKLSRRCCQTSNNQPLFMSLEIPWGFLARAVLRWLSRGLCHTRKCQFKDFEWREKVWFAFAKWTFAWETFGERRNGERKLVLILVPGSRERLPFRKRMMCPRNMGAHIQCGTSEYQKVWENGTRNWVSVQPRKAQRN